MLTLTLNILNTMMCVIVIIVIIINGLFMTTVYEYAHEIFQNTKNLKP